MQISARQLAELLHGTVEGDPDVLVSRPSKIEEGGEGTITFLANPKYEAFAYTTTASVLLVQTDFKPAQPIQATLVRVPDVYASIAFLLNKFGEAQAAAPSGISQNAFIHPETTLTENVTVGEFTVVEKGAQIGAGSHLYPQVYIGPDVKVGANCIVFPGVKIYRECEIGDNCIIHANTVIGSDGFGFAPQEDGTYKKIAQIGKVILEANVEVGANTVIDRATMGATIIRKGAKLDNLIQIAHNVDIGENTVIAAQAGIAGSTKLGKQMMVGGQAGFVGHIKVADGTKVQAQSGVARAVNEPGTALYGSPAIAYNDYLRAYAVFKKLPALYQRLNALEKKLAESENDT